MENNEVLLLTRDGMERFDNELNFLRKVKRQEMADRIREALSHGDIADNPEYEDAKNGQAFIEGRIITLEKMLRRARLLEKNRDNGDHVELGSTVKLRDLMNGKTYEYTLVSTAETNPFDQKISDESPVGRAVMGRAPGERVIVKAPIGTLKYKIEKVR